MQSIAQDNRSDPAGASVALTGPEVRQLWWFLAARMHAYANSRTADGRPGDRRGGVRVPARLGP